MNPMALVYVLVWLALLAFCLYILNLILATIPNIPPQFKTIALALIGLIAFAVILAQFGLLGDAPRLTVR